ncbi:MAG: 30S ribosomal protein S1 [Chlorobiaceae bacterium]|nr:30S ribosomal protein S1 [Chlorobiaceae bacterium]
MAEEQKDTILQQKTTDVGRTSFQASPVSSGGSSFNLASVEEREYTEQEYKDLSQLYDRTFSNIQESQIVKGKIVAITDDSVAIDIGFKSEGLVPIEEFPNIDELSPGDEVEVYLESVENKDGQLVLSRKRADFMRTWERVVDAFNKSEILQGKITRRIKGGLVVDLMGLDAFLPGSQIDIKPVRDFDQFIGKTMEFKIAKINHPNENVVVSHKVLIEAEMHEQRSAILGSLEKGQVLEGTAKAITDFGVFVDLGGVDGLIHITDLSWGRINHPSEVVKLDQTITVVVIDFDEAKKRISLGLKQLQPHPWEKIDEKYPVGTKVTGKVVSLADYGAFIEVEKGIEGLIHISEMSWTQHIKHPSQMVSMGQMIEAIILSLDKENKKISLGMKQLEPDPWLTLLQQYPIDSKHIGTVRNLTNFGVFVELEEGVDGLVHISDLSWTKKIRHPGEVVKKGEKLEVIILGIDVEQRRISLGHKQVKENPWDTFGDLYKIGTESSGKIVRLIEKGVIVELPQGVDGFVPISQLSMTPLKNIADAFKVNDELPLRVLEFDKESKKIVLSVVEYLKHQEQKAIDDYTQKHKLPSMTLKEVAEMPMKPIEAPPEEFTGPPTSDFMM